MNIFEDTEKSEDIKEAEKIKEIITIISKEYVGYVLMTEIWIG